MDEFIETIKQLEKRVEDLEKKKGGLEEIVFDDAFENDGSGDLMPANGLSLFDMDGSENVMPCATNEDRSDPKFDLDGNGDIMPKV